MPFGYVPSEFGAFARSGSCLATTGAGVPARRRTVGSRGPVLGAVRGGEVGRDAVESLLLVRVGDARP